TTEKPYHSKRPHKKSRAGCINCKKRKVKCSEERPTCRACTLRRESCIYPGSKSAGQSPSASSLSQAVAVRDSSLPSVRRGAPQSPHRNAGDVVVTTEPQFRPTGVGDDIDMKMLWFYTAEACNSFSIEGGRSPTIDHVLKVKVVEHAFKSPFLMQCLMALSALQLRGLGQEVPYAKTLAYQSKAYEGYRDAIEAARPADYPALLACSLLMTALSSQMFREADTKPLYIVDWMAVWRGIGLIIEIISPQSITDSGLAVLFYRPPIDVEKTGQFIPNNLLFMVSSIKPGDADYEHQQTYYTVLKCMGSLYAELHHGFSSILDLRIITFFSFMPREFIPLAKEHRPRALVILGYYLCFAKLNNDLWWMQGISDREIKEILHAVGKPWLHLLHVPRKIMHMTDKIQIMKTILAHDTWAPPDQDLSDNDRDPRVKQPGIVSDNGRHY
ncbi:uncharacterized protein BCR38DRAFT_314914, partial [Pseudomassariella vexata]